jgi:demethylmenaquinone methyltransferase/2-methoxy-6-polyprenyl-1,4-benzoquinol methylase
MVAFGVRNFSEVRAGLSEMYRVLKTHGKTVMLEFSQPKRFPIRQLYLFYFHNLLPIIGHAFSRNGSAYRYLPASVSSFPEEEKFVKIMQQVGFVDVTYRNLSSGIATVYIGTK